jgi:ribonuclease HI
MPEQADILVFSDGSGYAPDGFGGWAAIACTPDRTWKTFRMGSTFGLSVDRAEMTGLLEGLEMALSISRALNRAPDMEEGWKPTVAIFTDRENMALSIKGVYDRSNCPDLWYRFSYYESQLNIIATHVARETDYPEFALCDLHASTGRLVAKDYGRSIDMPDYTLPMFK